MSYLPRALSSLANLRRLSARNRHSIQTVASLVVATLAPDYASMLPWQENAQECAQRMSHDHDLQWMMSLGEYTLLESQRWRTQAKMKACYICANSDRTANSAFQIQRCCERLARLIILLSMCLVSEVRKTRRVESERERLYYREEVGKDEGRSCE